MLILVWISTASWARAFLAGVLWRLANEATLLFHWEASMLEMATDSTLALAIAPITTWLSPY